MPTVKLRTRVFGRDAAGRFLSELALAKNRTLESVSREGEQVAFVMAPKKSGRTASTIKGSIQGNQAVLEASGPVAMWQELGTRRHDIDGRPLSFWWEKQGVHFIGPKVDHPGNPAVHFLLAGFNAMNVSVMRFARLYYPK